MYFKLLKNVAQQNKSEKMRFKVSPHSYSFLKLFFILCIFFVSWSLSVFLTFHLYLSLFISLYLCLSFLCPPSPRAITAQKNVWVLPKQILKTDVKEAKKLHSSKKSKWTKKGMFSTSFFAKA